MENGLEPWKRRTLKNVKNVILAILRCNMLRRCRLELRERRDSGN
jgi:hypothetical protein